MTMLQSIDTEYPADSTEWCPVDGYTDILLCGTYQLVQSKGKVEKNDTQVEKQNRVGRLYVYRYASSLSNEPIQQQNTMDMPGILDIKWSAVKIKENLMFGLVNSLGQIRIYELCNNSLCTVAEAYLGDDTLGLSLDWSNRVDSSCSPYITCSDSGGSVHILHLTPSGLKQESKWKAHEFETWITAFDYWNTNILYSGGDDCKLKIWDKRIDPCYPAVVSKRHTMGVCSIQSCPVKQHLLCTGSYDENVFIWDSRNMKNIVTETSLGGGIWRVKWEPQYANMILTATMYNGFHIVDLSNTTEGIPILCHFNEHNSLAYGADWYHCNIQQEGREIQHSNIHEGSTCTTDTPCREDRKMIATCSFYDHCLKLWTFNNAFA